MGTTGCADQSVRDLLARAHDGDDMARGKLMAMGETDAVSGFLAFAIGQVYDPGLFDRGDAKRAAYFYRKAKDAEPKGGHNLAVLVLTGQLSEADGGFKPLSLQQLVIAAAEGGVAESMVLAGEFYTLGVQSFPRNEVLATWWFERAVAASGDAWARYRLGEAYLLGKVRSRSKRFAYDLLASAAKAGVPEAAELLASTSTDRVAAARWSVVSARMAGEDARSAKTRITGLSSIEASRISAEVAVWMSVHQATWSAPHRIIRPAV
jgi:TPR repeat protein